MREFRIFRGWFGARRVSVQHIIDELNEPIRPEGISNRHWNMLPQDLRGGERDDMILYIEGWESARDANYNNPYPDQLRGEVWNRGFDAWWNRRNGVGRNYTDVNFNPPIDERYPEYYNTDDFVFCDVTEIRYDRIDGRPFKLMLYRSIEGGNTIEGNRINRDHPMWNFPDVI
jgi:hypothetical protein